SPSCVHAVDRCPSASQPVDQSCLSIAIELRALVLQEFATAASTARASIAILDCRGRAPQLAADIAAFAAPSPSAAVAKASPVPPSPCRTAMPSIAANYIQQEASRLISVRARFELDWRRQMTQPRNPVAANGWEEERRRVPTGSTPDNPATPAMLSP